MKSRALAVGPQDRDLIHAQAGAPGEEENFRIESPAFNFLQWKNALCRISPKSFESALRVCKTQAQNQTQRKIEDSSECLAIQWLTLGLQFYAQPARAYRDVGTTLNRVEQLLRLRYWRRKIGICEKANITTSVQHPIANAVTFAAVSGILDQQNLRM